ncbi:MAG: fructose-1,6-bisphosphatase I [Gammaproteobacteria bacterium]|jgi:fructose-1,6-bisphosphatase I
MSEWSSLAEHLDAWAGSDAQKLSVAHTVQTIAEVSIRVSELIAEGDLAGALDASVGENVDGDTQKALDIQANDLFIAALRASPVGVLGSEELDDAIDLGEGTLALTLDPLDGSSNIATNVSVGSIFSIYSKLDAAPARASILQVGDSQLGAGFVIYGPQTTLALTLRDGTHIFTLSRKTRSYWRTTTSVAIPRERAEYAINSSNARHWEPSVRAYIDQCVAGKGGPLGNNYNTRWVASLVAEAFRIFARGGVFLYPSDRREGYHNGRLRLVYEANAIALLVEQAGGLATNGRERILTLTPSEVHQRTALVFGSAAEVERVGQLTAQ